MLLFNSEGNAVGQLSYIHVNNQNDGRHTMETTKTVSIDDRILDGEVHEI